MLPPWPRTEKGGSGVGRGRYGGAFDERAHNFAPFMFYSPILACAPTKEREIKNFHFLFIPWFFFFVAFREYLYLNYRLFFICFVQNSEKINVLRFYTRIILVWERCCKI